MRFKIIVAQVFSYILLLAAILFAFSNCEAHNCPSNLSHWEVSILSITAFIALRVYISSREVEEVKLLCTLRNMLSTGINMQIHAALEDHKQRGIQIEDGRLILQTKTNKQEETSIPIHDAKMYNYLGTLELCKIILDHGIMSEKSFKNQFGYRIYNVIYQKQLARLIYNDANSWTDLMTLINSFDDYKRIFKQNV